MSDLILTHARIYTMDAQGTTAEAVAIQDERVVAVGANADVLNLRRPETRVISLNGATLLPGFNDAHCHVLSYGYALGMASLTSPPVQTIADIVRLLQERADHLGATGETWVRGRGYDQNKLQDGRHPDRHDLDAVQPNPYVLVTHTSGHAVSVNSRVLAKAGITRDTADPPGGTIVRDAAGEPTGVLLENAMMLATRVGPSPTPAEKVEALRRASEALHQMGITSASDANTPPDDIAAFREADAQGALSVRCTLMIPADQLADGDRVRSPDELRAGPEGPFVHVGQAKLFSDGALTTRTALLRSPYVDGAHNHGTAIWEPEQLNSLIWGAHQAGWQIATHAIGDGAIDLCLDAYGAAQARHPRLDARHRIEHAMLLRADHIDRLVRLGVLPVYQPEFIARLGDAYIAGLGRARADRLMPYRDTQAAGLPLIFSSDLPVVPGAPLSGVAAAVQRRTPQGHVLGADQCVGASEALRAYTAGAAYSAFAETDRGQIASGLRADFVVLSHDPTTLPPGEWADGMTVRATLVGGHVVYGKLGDD